MISDPHREHFRMVLEPHIGQNLACDGTFAPHLEQLCSTNLIYSPFIFTYT